MRINGLLHHILFLTRIQDIRAFIMVLLLELDFDSDCDGFDYLVNAVIFYRMNPLQSITQSLYSSVAKECDQGVTPTQIEQSIRRAINSAWSNRDEAEWQRYFPKQDTKPTNGQFISRLARLVDLWEGCKSGEEVSYDSERGLLGRNDCRTTG